MGSLIKWLLGIVVLLVVLVAGAVVILPMVVDPNDYKEDIVAAVKEQTGRDFAIQQDLKLSVFPWLGIETGGVTLGNAKGFKAASFAEVKQLGVRVKLMPLLSSRVEVDTLVLDGLRLNLEKDAKGRTNWDDLAKGQKSADDKPAADSAGGPVAFSVQGVQVEDAAVNWDDRQSGESYRLQGVKLVTGALAPGAVVPVQAGFRLESTKPRLTVVLELSGDANANAEFTRYEVKGLKLVVDAKGEGLPADGARVELDVDVVADTKADTLKLSGLKVSGPAVQASGELSVSALQAKPAVQGRLSLAETNPKTLAAMFGSRLETADPDALTRVSGEFTIGHKDGATRIDPLKLRLDDSNLTGHLHLLDTKGPKLRTKLSLDQINLDRYMAGGGEQPQKKDESAPADDPFAGLRPLDLVGDFDIGKLTVAKARMANVKAKVTAKGGLVRVDPATADLYDGKYAGSVELDARKKTPLSRLVTRLTGVQVGPLLVDLAGQDKLTGTGEINTDLRTVGLSEQEVRKSLSGTASFAFRDGAVKGVNIAKMLRSGGAALGMGGGGTAGSDANQTDFSELSASFKANDGVIDNRDLQAKSPLLRLKGEGKVDLPQDSVNYLLTTELVASLEGQGGKGSDQLAGIPIPVRVKGPLQNPRYEPDFAKIVESGAAKKVQEELGKRLGGGTGGALKDGIKTDNVKDAIKGAIDGGALKGLFGR